MARTIEQIQNSIIADKEASAELSELTSTSKLAIWRLWVYIFSVATFLLETMWDKFSAEVELRIENTRAHTVRWYKEKALAFQYEDELNDKDYYDVIDEEKQLVKQVAIEEGQGEIKVKIAGDDGNGNMQPVEPDVKNAFFEYMGRIKDAGTYINVVNNPPDDLKLVIDIYYDALVMKSDGTVKDQDGQPYNSVELAIDNYLKSIDFNGEIILSKLVDYIQLAKGVKDVVLLSAQSRFGLNEFSEILRARKPDAGYMKLTEKTINYTVG